MRKCKYVVGYLSSTGRFFQADTLKPCNTNLKDALLYAEENGVLVYKLVEVKEKKGRIGK